MTRDASDEMTLADALVCMKEVERYLRSIVQNPGDGKPVTKEGFRDMVAEAKADLRGQMMEMQAFLLGYMKDEPVPLKFLQAWGSRPTFLQWEREGLKLIRFNGKTMVRPSVFFEFIEKRIKTKETKRSPT